MDFDVVVLGTGLSESITAAALAKAGYKVAHLDANSYYGGDDASFSLDEFVSWADERTKGPADPSAYLAAQRSRFAGISYSGSPPSQSRQYAISLQPSIIPSIGPLIDSLVASGVSRYSGFKLVERVAIFDSRGFVKLVPSSKEDVFKNKKLSLLHKRRLMRFLMFAGGEFEDKPELQHSEDMPFAEFLQVRFSLDPEAVQVIVYALAFCLSALDPTLPALQRIRRYLRSNGRYGTSPFLVGHYGGLGEISQGFCRTSAVAGATYILGRRILSIDPTASMEAQSRNYTVQLEHLSERLFCDIVLTSSDFVLAGLLQDRNVGMVPGQNGPYTFARCVAIIDKPIRFATADNEQPSDLSDEVTNGADTNDAEGRPKSDACEVDTAVLVFPPACLETGSSAASVNVLITGEGSQSTPRGKWILYITMPLPGNDIPSQSAEELLQPYLDATLSLVSSTLPASDAVQPLFTLSYMQYPGGTRSETPASSSLASSILHTASYAPHLPEIGDSAAIIGESTFWGIVKSLAVLGRHPGHSNRDGKGEGEAGTEREVESFWPPLEYMEENEEW